MLHLKPGRRLLTDSEAGDKYIKKDDILQYVFSEPLGSIEGWTLRDLMEYIQPYGLIFGEMAKCNFAAFYKEMNGPKKVLEDPGDNAFVNNIKYISVTRIVSFQDEEENEICEYYNVDGRNDEATDGGRYAIEFTSISLLADLPIKVDDKFEIQRSILNDGNTQTVLSCKKPMYLLDLIWAILWEISFFGSPENRDEKWDEIEGRAEDVKNGTVELIPMSSVEDFMRDIQEEIEREAYGLDGLGPYGAD
jgi:hypothetical protein